MINHCRECGHKLPEGSGPYFCDPCYELIIRQIRLSQERPEAPEARTHGNRSET